MNNHYERAAVMRLQQAKQEIEEAADAIREAGREDTISILNRLAESRLAIQSALYEILPSVSKR